jgi:hypothetical protein
MSKERPGNLPRLDAVSVARRTWRCPDETLLAAYVEQQLDERARRRIESHLADCDFCLSQVGFLLSSQEVGEPAAVPAQLLRQATDLVAPQGPATSRTAWQWGAVAATTACFLVIVVVSLRKPSGPVLPPAPPMSQQPRAPALPAPEIASRPTSPSTVRREPKKPSELGFLSPREGAVLSREEVVFRWKPVRDCEFYEVRLVTAEGDLVWEGRVEGTQARLPTDLELVSGQQYFVSVRAYLPEGKTLKSPTLGFRAQERR